MRSLALSFVVLCFFLTPLHAQWQWLNPLPEGNELYAAAYRDANNAWIVGGNGALLRSSNGGTSWMSQDNPLRPTPFLGLSIVFPDALTGLISMNNGALLRSTDGGFTWELLARTGLSIQKMRIAPDGSVWGYGSLGSISRSTDGGTSWEQFTTGISTVVYDVSFPDATTAVAACGNGVLLRSVDNGATWTQIAAPYGTDVISVDFSSPTHGIALQQPRYVLRSTDGGQSWSDTTFGVNQLTQVRFATEETGWIVSNSPGSVYRTQNGGVSWESVTVEPTRRYTFLGILPVDAQRAMLMGVGGAIFTTDDAGAQWTQRGTAFTRNHLHGVTAFNDSTAWVFGRASAFLTRDRGQNWTGSDTISLPGFRYGMALSETRLIGAGTQGEVYLSTDAGVTWSSQTLAAAGQIQDIEFVDAQNGWLAGAHGTLARSSDGGATWTELSAGVTHDFHAIAPLSADVAWIAGAGGRIYKTEDGGQSWTEQSNPAMNDLFAIAFTSPTNGWAGGQQTLMRTTDGGQNWLDVSSLTGLDVVYDIVFTDAQRGYVMMSRSVARSSDGGQTFYRTDYPATGNQRISVTADGYVWLAGQFGVVQRYMPTPAIFIQPPLLNFGNVAINKQREESITVYNRGEVDMVFTTVATLGDGFLYASGDLSPLAPGASRTLTLAFAPIKLGPSYGIATVFSNAGIGVPYIDLQGNGIPAGTSALTHTPDTLDFGTLQLGNFLSSSVHITNRSTQPLLVTREVLTGGDSTMFQVTRESSFFLSAGRSDSIQITYGPLRAGQHLTRLLIATNDPVEPLYHIVVKGRAITPEIAAGENPLDFGWVNVDSTKTRRAAIRNIGTSPLHISAWTKGGTHAALFSFTDPGARTVQPGDSVLVDVHFTPDALGTKTAEISISSDDLLNSTFILQLRGNATTLDADNAPLPSASRLEAEHANPFSLAQHGVLRYRSILPEGQRGTLLLHDALGRLVARQDVEGGVHTVHVAASRLQPGVYTAVLRVNADASMITVRTVVLR